MSYHPIYGIIIFLISLFIAYIFGRKTLSKRNKNFYKKENNIYTREFISPDAPWLDKNKKSEWLLKSSRLKTRDRKIYP